MRSIALQRARHFARVPQLHRTLLAASVAAAVCTALLVLDLGLIVQLLVSRTSQEAPGDWLLGPWVSGEFVEWPFLGSPVRCMLLLIVFGVCLALALVGVRWWADLTAHRYALHLVTSFREAIHRQAYRLGAGELLVATEARPEIAAVDQTDALGRGLAAWWVAIPACPLMLLVLTILSLLVNPWLTLLALLLAGFLFRIHRTLTGRVEDRLSAMRALAEQRRAAFLSLLNFAPLAGSYSMDGYPADPVEARLAACQDAELRAENSLSIIVPAMLLMVLLSTGLLLFVVGVSDQTTVAGTAMLAVALGCAYLPAHRLARLPGELAEAELAAREVFAYLDREPAVRQAPSTHTLARLQREIRFDHVSLEGPKQHAILDEVVFEIPARKRIVLLASDPQTPRALGGLLVRLYDPTAGRVLFDGQDIRHVALTAVRQQAIPVWHDRYLFPGTIAMNVTCADEQFTVDQIRTAMERAGAGEFLQELPAELETRVGEEGVSLSERQAFQVALARALIREPSLLVIEEPAISGGVDEQHVDRALEQAAEQATLLTIPARLDTIRHADLVYVFHQGQLHARGRHAELLNEDEFYRHQIYIRFNAFRG